MGEGGLSNTKGFAKTSTVDIQAVLAVAWFAGEERYCRLLSVRSREFHFTKLKFEYMKDLVILCMFTLLISEGL
jgi:hypothetical protein